VRGLLNRHARLGTAVRAQQEDIFPARTCGHHHPFRDTKAHLTWGEVGHHPLFASDMSKGTVSAAMGMLQMLIFTVGIELSKHIYQFGGNGLFSLFNLLGGVLWLGLMVVFLKDKTVGQARDA